MTEEEIQQAVTDLYIGVFGRDPDPGGREHMERLLSSTGDVASMLHDFVHGDEAIMRRQRERELSKVAPARAPAPHPLVPTRPLPETAIDDHGYRVPTLLSRPESRTKHILLVGSCLMDHWIDLLQEHDPSLEVERIVFNNASALQEMSDEEIRAFDFQIIQIGLRSLLMEPMYLRLKFDDEAGWQAVYERALQALRHNVEAAMAYSRQAGLRTFVLNLPLPQQNPMGRFQPRYRLNNLTYFVEQLNRELHALVSSYGDAHIIDFDQIIATYGRKYFQDDSINTTVHSSALMHNVGPLERARLEPFGHVKDLYGTRLQRVVATTYEEALAMDRTIRQHGSVKIAIFDLDDTLWRGIAAEIEDIGFDLTEGWPIGVIEAISMLWRRGVLIAIVSKNDEAHTRANWQKLYGRDFPIENFAAVKIGWEPKPIAIGQILQQVNLLPGNAIFVDDNPVERAGVLEAFPDIRVVGGSPLEWRRILLWSAETQVAAITSESGTRTEMIQAQMLRTTEEATMDRASFLASLNLSVTVGRISSSDSPQFARALELINKTNQFNTTGHRWSHAELCDLFAGGGYLLIGKVSDRFVDYGLVAVAIVRGDLIEQYVMSCRVFGMEIEQAMVAAAVTEIARSGAAIARGRIAETDRNKLSMPLYSANGFAETGDGLWSRQTRDILPYPAHVQVIA